MCELKHMHNLDFDNVQHFSRVLEALLLAADKPLSVVRMIDMFDDDHQPSVQQINAALEQLGLDTEGRSYQLVQVASGFRLQVRTEYAPWVGRLWEERPQRYSRAMLETLALIAYRQPITRGEIEDVRGVAVSAHIIKTLLEREWIGVVGHKDVPGKPAMLATTQSFLDAFNLRGLNELPNADALQALSRVEIAHKEEAAAPTAQEHVSSAPVDTLKNTSQVSFSSLLEELEGMERDLTTEFIDPAMDNNTDALDELTEQAKGKTIK